MASGMSTRSVMSMLRNSKTESRMCSMFCSEPVSRLSTQITRCPCPSRCSQRWEPRKPAPPVTTQVLIAPDAIGLRAEGPCNLRTSSSVTRPEGGRTSGAAALPWACLDNRSEPVRGSSAGVIQREARVKGESRAAAADTAQPASDGARKRAAVELIARHEASLKRTARRYSIDAEDAEDAFQRAMEIVLTKAPTTDARDLIRWTQTVTKHEALAVRYHRERLLGYPAARDSDGVALDRVATIAAGDDGPDEQAERHETVARTREALRALKPAELRSLTLLAEGYSYA